MKSSHEWKATLAFTLRHIHPGTGWLNGLSSRSLISIDIYFPVAMERTITIIDRPSHFLFPGRHGSSNSIRRPSARASSHHVYCYVCHKSRIRGLVLVVAVRGAVAFVVVDAVRGAVGFVVTVAHGGAVAFVVAVAVGGTMGLVVAVTVGGTMGFVCTCWTFCWV